MIPWTIILSFLFPSQFYTNGLVFTFDDGPSLKYTPKVLDILKKHKVKAVFCIPAVNLLDKRRVVIAKRALKEGHAICNHSYSHPDFGKISKTKQRWEILHSQRIFKNKLGITPKYFRPPCGVITRYMRQVLKENNLKLLYWDIDPRDWSPRTTAYQIYYKVIRGWLRLRKRGKTGVVLFHDVNKRTISVIEKIIIRVKK